MLKTFTFALIAFLAFTCLTSAFTITTPLQKNETNTIALNGFGLPPRPSGLFSITVTTHYTLLVCLQEGFEILGDLSSCNPDGFFNFSRVNDSDPQPNEFTFSLDENSVFDSNFVSAFMGDAQSMLTTTQSTTIRGNATYYLSYGFQDPTMPDNATCTLSVDFNQAGCPVDTVGLSNGTCVGFNPPSTSNVYTAKANGDSVFFEYSVSKSQNQFFTVTLNLANEQSDDFLTYEEATSTPSNISLYVRRNAAPDSQYNDGSATLTNGSTVTLTVPTPAPGSYYIEVRNLGSADANFQLEADAQGCKSGLVGPQCNSSFVDLTNNITVIEVTGSGNYDYYQLDGNILEVGVGTKKLKEDAPELLVSIYNFPENETAMAKAAGNPVNFIYANYTAQKGTTFYISVWAEEDSTYYIWANYPCPNNCAGSGDGVNATSNSTVHGFCNVNTGTCDCDKGYSGLFCDRSRLATVWIVILIIGPAIILAIAIGVPVACFLRNRRRAQYERV